MTGKILVAWPFHYHIPVQWFYSWIRMDHSPCMGQVASDEVGIVAAMGRLVDMALTHYPREWDRLVVMEHDMIIPPDGFKKMANYDPEEAIVGGLYFQHTPPHRPYLYADIDSRTELGMLEPEHVQEMLDKPMLYACAATGFGFVGIARHVIEQWDPNIPMFDYQEPWGSHDLWFCVQAKKQGWDTYVDSSIRCGHLTTAPVTWEDNQRFNKRDEDGDQPTG